MGLSDAMVNGLIWIPTVLGLIWALKEAMWVASIKIDGHPGLESALVKSELSPARKEECLKKMRDISGFIAEGAVAFLIKEYQYMMVYVVVFGLLVWFQVGHAACLAFVVGALTSIIAGYVGMKIAVFANVRTTHECWLVSLAQGYAVAVRAGSVMGFSLVALGVGVLYALILLFTGGQFFQFGSEKELYEALAGYGLGGSSIALFGRVGGGIYTKAADVGADLSGKNEWGMDEDDPRNPACIADNVGDNVGDVAGMGADLFGSFAESTCAALVIASASGGKHMGGIADDWSAMMFPVMLSSTGIIVGILTMLTVNIFYVVKEIQDVEKALKGVLVISTILDTPVVILLGYLALPAEFALNAELQHVQWWHAVAPIIAGLWSGLIIGFATEYYTSFSYAPVREVSDSQKVSAATGIIFGLALGYLSCIIPVLCLAVTILVGHILAGMYGVALAALGMLGSLTMSLAIDVYGPISDNAGGIAEMSELDHSVRKITDGLDAAGNTTAAIGKGFAIGSAALVSLALFGAYCVRARVDTCNILDPWVFTGLLLGAMVPYAFSAMTMKSVGKAANEMFLECNEQMRQIFEHGAEPDYQRCISISTQASLNEMILPGALVILSPLVCGVCFGKNTTAGLLAGGLVSGVQMAISMSNTGGAWDNAKKYIEGGHVTDDKGQPLGKGSAAHKNAVTGDTVGDPLKDTSGPSLNIVMKLSAIVSLVFGSVIADFSNEAGGPFWLK